MALSTEVIVSGINNLSDARYCAGMGVSMLGFNTEPRSEGYISPGDFKEIAGWISGVELVGQFDQSSAEEINEATATYGLNLVQLNTLYLLDDLTKIQAPVILRLLINKDTLASELKSLMSLYRENVTHFLLCSDDFTSIDQTNIDFLADLAHEFPLLLGFGISKDSIRQTLDQVKPTGIGLVGGNEIRPGLKDFDELQDILEVLEMEG